MKQKVICRGYAADGSRVCCFAPVDFRLQRDEEAPADGLTVTLAETGLPVLPRVELLADGIKNCANKECTKQSLCHCTQSVDAIALQRYLDVFPFEKRFHNLTFFTHIYLPIESLILNNCLLVPSVQGT